ncbi:MAG: methionyl-tRNA formyltransferase [Phyllobacteriaceae bacterium]|nr:methionyl-tRNA formyltransferase [Phyllobacteriaceae bacterium]
MRIVFMGTPEFAAATLRAVHAAGHDIVAVYAQPPRPGGRRGLELVKSPVHVEAESLGLSVRTPVSLKIAEEQASFVALDADVAVVVAYGLLLPKAVIEGTRLGCFNGHASKLPRWRGAAPIQRAIMAGDAETAMTIMKMDEGLDTGPIALERAVAIGADMTGGELHDALREAGADLMVEALARLERGDLPLRAQPVAAVAYAKKIDKAEARIDWTAPAVEVHNRIRALSPAPGAWCEMIIGGVAERVKLLRSTVAEGRGAPGALIGDDLTVACGDGAVRLLEVQRTGGKPMAARHFLLGAPVERVA